MRNQRRDDGLPWSSCVARSSRTSLVLVVSATVAWSCAPSTLDSAAPVFDVMEKTIADAVGPVDVHVVNHHGSVEPRVLGGAPASRPYRPGPLCKHPAPSVLKRLLSQRAYEGPRDVFILQFREPTKAAIGPRRTRCKAAPATSSCASRPGARPIASSW